MSQSAITRLRDTCRIAARVLVDAEAALGQEADPMRAAAYVATARRILESGVSASICRRNPALAGEAADASHGIWSQAPAERAGGHEPETVAPMPPRTPRGSR